MIYILRKYRHLVNCKALIMVFVISIIWIELYKIGFSSEYSTDDLATKSSLTTSVDETFEKMPLVINKLTEDQNTSIISNMKDTIRYINAEQKIFNENVFEPLRNDSVVIVVQVHKRIEYLRHLISSLSRAVNISRALVIFSHDYYSQDINSLIQNITFCKVMQIFYPFSIQINPSKFPGTDPNDCQPSMKKEQALEQQCNSALYPDSYGHYREAKIAQVKHHWWWKVNKVFDLKVIRYYSGLVTFFEEDYYVVEDFIHMLHLMQEISNDRCVDCSVFALGKSAQTVSVRRFQKQSAKAVISQKANMGLAFNRTTWLSIMQYKRQFCEYDDYNWDYSFLHVLREHLNKYIMYLAAPRIIHIGKCGLHVSNKNCDANVMVQDVVNDLRKSTKYLYPTELSVQRSSERTIIKKGFGGWGDPRDHMLCLNMDIFVYLNCWANDYR